MPEMNGKALAGLLTKSHPRMKCLFMSGYTANVIALRGILEKGLNFIAKPFSSESLSAKLSQVPDPKT